MQGKILLGQRKIFCRGYWKDLALLYIQSSFFFVTGVCVLCVSFVSGLSLKTKIFIICFVVNYFFTKRFFNRYLPDRISLFVCQRWLTIPNLFDTFCDFCTQEIIENPYFLFKRYLEIVCRGFFNSIYYEIFPYLRKMFRRFKPTAANESDLAVVFIQCQLIYVKIKLKFTLHILTLIF